jgi:hypothetical protein
MVITCGHVRWMPFAMVEPWKFTSRWFAAVAGGISSYQRRRSRASESMKSIFTPATPQRWSVGSHRFRSSGVSRSRKWIHTMIRTFRSAAY